MQRITVDIDPNELAKNLGGQLAGVRLIDLDNHKEPCSCPVPGAPQRILATPDRPVAGVVLSPKVAVQLIFKEPVELDDPFA